jgi:hypothetical protein
MNRWVRPWLLAGEGSESHAWSVAWAGQSKEHQVEVWCSGRLVRLY